MASALLASLLAAFAVAQPAPPAAACATGGLHAACFESGCCADPSLACYKRAERDYAQCLPRVASCVDTAEWLCPGWELCSARFANCQRSQCCQAAGDVCYMKHAHFSQCRPAGDCVGRRDPTTNVPWLCSILHAPDDTCSPDWQECTSTKCCTTPGFTCFEKSPTFARCMRVCPDPGSAEQQSFSCAIHDRNQIDTQQLLPHRHGSSHQTCSPNRGECTVSGCCENPGYTCYERGEHYAMCLPGGECRSFWPESTGASCSVRARQSECAAAGGDCSQSNCCSAEGYTCFQRDAISHEAKCMRGCHSDGEGLSGWECNVIDIHTRPPPAPPAPPPGPYCARSARQLSIL